MKSYKFIISGKVQGVFYRKSVTNNANRAKFSGYIKNLANGDVEAVVTCKENRLNEFITILKSGSQHSKISKIKQTSIGALYNGEFQIKY